MTIDPDQIWPTIQRFQPAAINKIGYPDYEDALQDAALYTLTNLDKCYKDLVSFCYWAVYNACINIYNQDKRHHQPININTTYYLETPDYYRLKSLATSALKLNKNESFIIQSILQNTDDADIAHNLNIPIQRYYNKKSRSIKHLQQLMKGTK